MSVASARGNDKPFIIDAIASAGIASGVATFVFTDVLPAGSWIVCGSIELSAGADFESIAIEASNGLTATKYVLADLSVAQTNCNVPFTHAYWSDGVSPNDLTVTAETVGAVVYSVVASPTIQCVKVG
jgi:hypothetical protein